MSIRRAGFLARRIARGALILVLVLWVAATLAFFLMRVLPGDPVSAQFGADAQVSDAVRAQVRQDLGLDRPVLVQYADYLVGLVRGDLGVSYQLRLPVTTVIGQQLGATLELTGLALAFALVIVAIVAVIARGRAARQAASVIEQIVLATPVFWIGMLLLGVFAFGLGWFPVSGSRGLPALVLPALTLALGIAALLGQLLRDGIEQAEREPFALTVRARGASPGRLLFHHTARHALGGVLPMAAYVVGSLLGGAVLVEKVFARQGLGGVALRAILNRDLPVIAGVLLMSTAVFIVVAVVTDLLTPLIDPRQRERSVPGGTR